jgi:preprotein translocase subunit SecE
MTLYCQTRRFTLAEKTNQQNPVARFYRETVGELRKVSWPTRAEATRLTIIVLIVMAVMAAVLGLVDWLGVQGLGWVLSLPN